MFCVRRNIRFSNINKYVKCQFSAVTNPETKPAIQDKPQYPPIEDLSYKAKKAKKHEQLCNEIKNLDTVEEKIIKINMPRYYGFKCTILNESKIPYNCLPFIQHCTETVLMQDDSANEFYKKNNDKVDSLLKTIKNDIEDAILFELTERRHKHEIKTSKLSKEEKDLEITKSLLFQINRIILNALSADAYHLNEVEVDVGPRHEAFWLVDGILPPTRIRNVRKNDFQKEYHMDPILRQFQYIGQPILTLRHKLPLDPFNKNVGATRNDVPRYKYDPVTLSYVTEHRHGASIPGFWPGSSYEHATLAYQSRGCLSRYNLESGYYAEDRENLLHAIGIQASFAWLHSISCYLGFSTYNDLTYPLSTQTVVTDGKYWSYYMYQLNTNLIGNSNHKGTPNLCWASKEMKLYEEISDKNTLIGFNDDSIKQLIHFYLNTPQKRNDVEMKPFLDKKINKVADIEDEKRRIFLENAFKRISSNRPRHLPMYEIYNWEKLYKIDNKTLPLCAKRRPFELGINPFKRRLDEHCPKYIPKALRPEGSRRRDKFEKTYYP